MLIDLKTLIHLPVFTESGVKLGTIHDLELDVDTHSVRSYSVEPKFFGKESYRIRPSQIKLITLEKIIVEDALLKEKEKEIHNKEHKHGKPALGGVVSIIDKDV